MSRRGHRATTTGVVAGAVVCVVGVALWHSGATRVPADATTTSHPAETRAASPSAVATQEPVLDHTVPAGAPRRVMIPDLGVSAPVLAVKAPAGTLVPPSDPMQLGWWSQGALPGAAHGSALITGHTVHAGGSGALNNLEELRRGDPVRVRTSKGTLHYRVVSSRVLGKGRLADRAQRLFEQDGPARLVLVTCEDWNGHEYLSNVVVTALPVRP